MATKAKSRAATIGEFFRTITGLYREKGSRHVTLWRVGLVHSLLVEGAGVRAAAELERADIIPRFGEALAARYKAGSIQWRATTALFHAILRHGHRLGVLLAIPPLPSIPHASDSPRGEKSSPPPEADVDLLFGHVDRAGTWKEGRFRVLVYLVGDAGLNVAHACQLEVANVDLKGRTIVTGFKGKRPRRQRISPELASALGAWIPKAGCKWVLPGARKTGPWWHTSRWRHSPMGELRAACLAIGVEPFTFQQLRRFRAENPFWRPPAGEDGRPEPPGSARAAVPAIRLGAPRQPSHVRGVEWGTLTPGEHKALKLLASVFPGAMTGKQMDRAYGGNGWRILLTRLKTRDPAMAGAILFPQDKVHGSRFGLYGIAPWSGT